MLQGCSRLRTLRLASVCGCVHGPHLDAAFRASASLTSLHIEFAADASKRRGNSESGLPKAVFGLRQLRSLEFLVPKGASPLNIDAMQEQLGDLQQLKTLRHVSALPLILPAMSPCVDMKAMDSL